MESLLGEVQFSHISCSHKVRSFVRKYLENWVTLHGLSRAHTFYRVRFTRNGKGHTVACEVEVQAHQQIWTGFTISDDLHQSLVRCLDKMAEAVTLGAPPRNLSSDTSFLEEPRRTS
ncbi:hypothetical protein WDW86_05940 [Bdellovibrionota bacterium FG-2]